MDDLLLRGRMNLPITTGAAAPAAQRTGQDTRTQTDAGTSFRQMLEQMAGGQQLAFSKHAAGRIAMREIPLSQAGLERLSEGVRIAKQKGLNDTLIIVDDSAFVVNTGAGKVITGLQGLSGRVITNIDGTVIV